MQENSLQELLLPAVQILPLVLPAVLAIRMPPRELPAALAVRTLPRVLPAAVSRVLAVVR